MKTHPSLLRSGSLSALILACVPAAYGADQWWDVSNANGLTPGSNAWDTMVASWASSASPGTANPTFWVDGNNAFFAVSSASTALVNGVTAHFLDFSSAAPWVFLPGSGALTITGGITNRMSGGSVQFFNEILLGGHQTWHISGSSIMVTGRISGVSGDLYQLTKTGANQLSLSNSLNQFSGVRIRDGLWVAFNNSLGNSTSTPVILGGADQLVLNNGSLNTSVAGINNWVIGNLTNAGAVRLNFQHNTAPTATNVLNAQELVRAGRGTLILAPASGNVLGGHAQVFFTGGTNLVNGMLAPWMINGATGTSAPDFLSNDVVRGVINVTYDTGAWTTTKKISSGATTLSIDTNVYALKLTGNVTNNANLILGDGTHAGLLMNNGGLLGSGTLSVGTAELIVGLGSGTGTITPHISGSGGLTLMTYQSGTLVISNLTYTGDTWINGGTLVVAPTGTTTYANSIYGVGGLTKSGPGTLNLNGAISIGGALSATLGTLNASGGTTADRMVVGGGGIIQLSGANVFRASSSFNGGALLIVTNATVQSPGLAVGTLTHNNTVQVLAGSTWNLQNNSLVIATGDPGVGNSVTNNQVVLDGGGVVGGAVLTNVNGINVGAGGNNGLRVGNALIVTNGAQIFNSGAFSLGTGNNNSSNFYNLFWVDGGAVGSIVSNAGGFSIGGGGGGGYGNRAIIANAQIWSLGLTMGSPGTNNTIEVRSGTTWDLLGSGNNLAINGVNAELVVDGSVLTNFGRLMFNASSSTVTVTNGGKLFNLPVSNNMQVGQGTANSQLRIVDGGQFYDSSGQGLQISGGGGSGNELIIRGGTYTNSAAITVLGTASGITVDNGFIGSSGALTIGSGGSNNFLNIQNNGSVIASSLTVGSGAATGNVAFIRSGGLLQANSLVTGAGAGNLITNSGGVYQFTTATPTITTNAGIGSIAIANGTIAFRDVSTGLNLTNNWRGSALTNLAWSGNNTLRLNNSTATNTVAGGYTFNTGLGATNYYRLEMISGNTKVSGTGVTIGSGGAFLASNTVAAFTAVFTNNSADARLVNSTVEYADGLHVAGTLTLVNSHVAGAGGKTVAGSGRLEGDGTVVGDITVAGAVAPGLSIGTMIFSNNLTLAGTYEAELDGAGNAADQLIVLGTLDITGASLSLTEITPLDDAVYILASYGTLVGTFSGVSGLPAGYVLDYNYLGGNAIAVVPEPSALALVGLGLLAALLLRRRQV